LNESFSARGFFVKYKDLSIGWRGVENTEDQAAEAGTGPDKVFEPAAQAPPVLHEEQKKVGKDVLVAVTADRPGVPEAAADRPGIYGRHAQVFSQPAGQRPAAEPAVVEGIDPVRQAREAAPGEGEIDIPGRNAEHNWYAPADALDGAFHETLAGMVGITVG